MRRISVGLKDKGYELLIGTGLLDELGNLCAKVCVAQKAFVICDSNTGPLFLKQAQRSLESAGFDVHSFEFLAGESSKQASTWLSALETMAELGMTRDDVVIALGGGVVGDLAGFVAASYMRGCPLIQVPTSLLAMVDSSIGGKTAIDIGAGKNLVGAFWQPKLVVADLGVLRSVAPFLLRDSTAEIIKHALLADPELFEELEQRALITDDELDLVWLEQVVALNMSIKRDVVEADVHEHNIRQTLNLGHTIGHAVEAAMNYELGHGSCVSIGLCWIARSCAAQGICKQKLARRIEACCQLQGLPTQIDISPDEVIRRSSTDKKRHKDQVNVVVLRDVGSPEIMPMDQKTYESFVLAGYQGSS